MRTGAVIVAAGMSTRMKDLKQLMKIGKLSMAEHVVQNFVQAGVDEIVMVTGFQAEKIEKSLCDYDITFLRNNEYETTQMFDSAKIGLQYLKNRCDQILFCPVDIPMFTKETVGLLLRSEGKIAVPKCDGELGHPIRIDSDLIENILEYDGNKGLRGALEALMVRQTEVSIHDEGTIHDADTHKDYRQLVQIHNSRVA